MLVAVCLHFIFIHTPCTNYLTYLLTVHNSGCHISSKPSLFCLHHDLNLIIL